MSQINLADAWKIIDISLNNLGGMRSMPSPSIGLLQLLTSESNKSASAVKLGDVQAVDKGDGKVYKVTRRFFPRLGEGGVETFEYCPTGGSGIKPVVDEVYITNETISPKVVIDDALLRCILENKADYQNSYVNEVLRNHINKLGKEVATKVATGGFIGSFVKCDCDDAPVTIKNLPLFMASGLGINPVGESILDSDRKQAEIDQQFILVGGTLLDQYRKARAIASGNDLGFDASLLDITRAIYYDTNLPAAYGNNNLALAMAPGALQVITYAKHKGQFMKQFDTQLRETTVDPWMGLEHDVLVSYEICGEEVKMYIQFRTSWAVVGMPTCWSQDCKFDGVLDVFAYEVKCADTGYCDITPACGSAGAPVPSTAEFCTSADECDVPCRALFYTRCLEAELFAGAAVDVADAVAIQINGLPISVGATFDTGTEAGANGFIAAVQAALAAAGYVYSVSGGWDGATGMDIAIITTSAVTSVVVVSATGADVALTVSTENLINVYSASTASNGATITNLAWTTPTTTFNGAPSASLIGAIDIYGTYDNFYAIEGTQAGAYQLVITDSASCTDTYNADSCGELVVL
jgi:hypothetical protein